MEVLNDHGAISSSPETPKRGVLGMAVALSSQHPARCADSRKSGGQDGFLLTGYRRGRAVCIPFLILGSDMIPVCRCP